MKTKNIFFGIGVFLFLAFLSVSFFFLLIYPPEYIYRCLVWGVLGVGEDQVETRTIKASSGPFQFLEGTAVEEKDVRKLFEEVFQTNNLNSYLSSTKTQALIVIQSDRLLYEHYFNGYERNSQLQSHSVTKSFISALIGIALSEGKIHRIEDPITKYIPELAGRDARFSKMTIRHLLMMSSGIRFNNYFFFTSDSSLSGAYPDLRYAAINFTKIIDEPGQHFLYNDYNPQLLGILLERATGTSVSEYLESRIWQRIGMEYDASWILDSQWSGFEKTQGGLNARAIDFAKFGRLYLRKGAWQDQRILPESWVVDSTQEEIPALEGIPDGFYYKYMWWGVPQEYGESDYYAMGNYGQVIYLSPSKNLIILRFGEPGMDGISKWYYAAHEFTLRFEEVE